MINLLRRHRREDDLRYKKAEAAFLAAAYKLQRHPTIRLKVRNVAKVSGVYRSTFYNHHKTINELVATGDSVILSDLKAELDKIFASSEVSNERKNSIVFATLLSFISRRRKVFLAALANPANDSLIENMLKIVYPYLTITWFRPQAPSEESLPVRLYLNCLATIIKDWAIQTECVSILGKAHIEAMLTITNTAGGHFFVMK